jgi:integrase
MPQPATGVNKKSFDTLPFLVQGIGARFEELMREHGTGSLLKVRYKDKNGVTQQTKTWYLQYYDRGKRIRESAKTEDKHAAQRKLTQRLAEIGAGRVIADVRGLKYETVRDAWLAYPRERGPLKSASGLQHVNAFFKQWNIQDVNEHSIDRFIKHRRDSGAADPTIRRNLKNLQAILNYAATEPRFSLPAVPSFKRRMPNDSAPRQGFTNARTFGKLCAKLPPACRALAIFQFRTGCRTGAALAIVWDNVSADCDEIELPGEITKSGEPLTLPLVGDGLKDVAAYLKKQTRATGKPIFAVGRDGSKTGGKEAYRYHWNRICGELGLGTFDKKTRRYEGLRPHDMRRSAVKNMIRSGVSRNVAMNISGHRTESIFNRYHIIETEDIRNALRKTGRATKIGKR